MELTYDLYTSWEMSAYIQAIMRDHSSFEQEPIL